ncbi:hypothetical protein PG984_013522 [Apiospora sp. TS-2023a]
MVRVTPRTTNCVGDIVNVPVPTQCNPLAIKGHKKTIQATGCRPSDAATSVHVYGGSSASRDGGPTRVKGHIGDITKFNYSNPNRHYDVTRSPGSIFNLRLFNVTPNLALKTSPSASCDEENSSVGPLDGDNLIIVVKGVNILCLSLCGEDSTTSRLKQQMGSTYDRCNPTSENIGEQDRSIGHIATATNGPIACTLPVAIAAGRVGSYNLTQSRRDAISAIAAPDSVSSKMDSYLLSLRWMSLLDDATTFIRMVVLVHPSRRICLICCKSSFQAVRRISWAHTHERMHEDQMICDPRNSRIVTGHDLIRYLHWTFPTSRTPPCSKCHCTGYRNWHLNDDSQPDCGVLCWECYSVQQATVLPPVTQAFEQPGRRQTGTLALVFVFFVAYADTFYGPKQATGLQRTEVVCVTGVGNGQGHLRPVNNAQPS